MPQECMRCQHGSNCINGRYCQKLHAYVEYLPNPICNEDKDTEYPRDHHLGRDVA